MYSASSIQLPYLTLNAVRECNNPIEEESPIPMLRVRSSVLKAREGIQSTPTFKSLEPKSCKSRGQIDQISRNPYQTASVKAWGVHP